MRSKLFLITCVLVFAVALTGCRTAVPNTKGMTVQQATEAIESAGFRVGKVTYDEKAIGAVGAVILEDPGAGKRIKKGSLVVLTVAGPPPVPAPALRGLDAGKATAALVAVGLKLGVVSKSYDASVSAGMVASQNPTAGADALRGSSVAVVISKGRQPVPVPNLIGKTQADATKVLQGAGFKVNVQQKADDAKKGTVIAQKPAGGEVQPGSTVTVTVSSGLVRVPDVVSASAAYAKRQPDNAFFGEDAEQVWDAHDAYIADLLKGSGLKSQVELVSGWALSDSAKAYQTPKAGQLVKPGTTVKLVLPVWD